LLSSLLTVLEPPPLLITIVIYQDNYSMLRHGHKYF
jgi:hypothetical protein